jgi:hypothetical protein
MTNESGIQFPNKGHYISNRNDSGRLLVETARQRRIMLPLSAASVYTPG